MTQNVLTFESILSIKLVAVTDSLVTLLFEENPDMCVRFITLEMKAKFLVSYQELVEV
jgi:hypothetical protein